MQLEIECLRCSFHTTADWPETDPGKLNHIIDSLVNNNDEGLNELKLHHEATRPKIGRKTGLVSGHDSYKYRSSSKAKWEEEIVVSGDSALIVHR